MGNFWTENDFPADYSRMLLMAPRSAYIVKHIVNPVSTWDFSRQGGDVVQLDRYGYFHDQEPQKASYTKEARTRGSTQTIGTGNGRSLQKEKIYMTLRELTGPSAGSANPGEAGNVSVTLRDLMTAKQTLFDLGDITGFNNSIGASRLAVDYLLLEDMIYIYDLLETDQIYYPSEIDVTATVNLSLNGFGGEPPKFLVDDIRNVVALLRDTANNAMPFQDGNFRCIAKSRALNVIKRDPEFREIARYPGGLPVSQALVPGMRDPNAPVPAQLSPAAMSGMAATPYQVGTYGGQSFHEEIIPTGFVFEGVRFFVSENVPDAIVPNVTYSNANNTALNGTANRTAYQLIFFGVEAIGLAVGGYGPEIKVNEQTDYGRHLHLIWCHYMDTKLLNSKFVVVARSFIN